MQFSDTIQCLVGSFQTWLALRFPRRSSCWQGFYRGILCIYNGGIWACLLWTVWSGLGHPVQTPLSSLWVEKSKGLKLIKERPFPCSCSPAVQWLAMNVVGMRNLTRLQSNSAQMAGGCVAVLANTETPHCHTPWLRALSAVEQAETGGSSSHSPPMQVSSAVLQERTQAKQAPTCQLTTRAVSKQDAAVTAQMSLTHSPVTAQGQNAALCWAPQLSFARVSPGLYHLLFALRNPGAGEPDSPQSVI